MTPDSAEEASRLAGSTDAPDPRLVYVVRDPAVADGSDLITLRELWNVAWHGKWIVLGMTSLFVAVAAAYAFLATEWYRAEVVLAPAESRSTPALAGQLGGLAALAGISVGGNDSVEAVAILRSRGFTRAFIEDLELLPILFSDDWDGERRRWKGDNPQEHPDLTDGVRFFLERVLSVSEDKRSGLVYMGVEWKDADVAAQWATMLVERLNFVVRQRALTAADRNVTYLQSELLKTQLVTLQQSIGRLLEIELQKLMLARGTEEFAFKILDAAHPPREPVWPKRLLTILVGALVGAMLGTVTVFILHVRASSARQDSGTMA